MVMNIASGYASSVSNRYLEKSNNNLGLAMAKLSAGQRVMSARDDAASLAIGSRLQSEVSGQQQAYRNAGQAASMLRVADGGLDGTSDMLQRMKSLTVQAGSGHLSADDRRALDVEYQALASEVDRVSADTGFGGTKLLDGSSPAVDVKVGTGTGPSDEISASLEDVSASALSLTGTGIATQSDANAASAAIDAAIDKVQEVRADNGASQNRLEYAAANIATSIENAEAARSRLIDLDVARATRDLSLLKTQQEGGIYASRAANESSRALLNLFA